MNEDKTVALNFKKLPVPEKINKARLAVKSIGAQPTIFTNPVLITNAINDLETAWNNAADGSKIKVAIMHDKELILDKHMKHLGHYVDLIANGDESIIHLSSFDVKKVGSRNKPDFEVFLPDDPGAVGLRCKARKKTVYHWEYCQSACNPVNWVSGGNTDVASTFIGNLQSGVQYWFRVVLISATGEHPLSPLTIVPL
jgi:hypothetical protein